MGLSVNTFNCKSILYLSAPGAPMFVEPDALSLNEGSELELAILSTTRSIGWAAYSKLVEPVSK